jgi:sulfonate transport system ATP-binding protein
MTELTIDKEDTAAVRISGLRKAFGTKTVLSGIDLEIRRGEFFALLGPSGTGKTTLLRILAGLELPDAGTVLTARRRTTVYQEPRLIPARRVLANVTLGLPPRGRAPGTGRGGAGRVRPGVAGDPVRRRGAACGPRQGTGP